MSFLILAIFSFVFASEGSLATAIKSEKEKPKFQYTLLLDYTSNLYERDSDKYQDSSNFWLIPKLNLNNDDSIALITIFTKDFQDEERFDVSSANLVYNRKSYDFSHFTLGANARLILPVNENLKDRQGLLIGTAFELAPKIKMENFGLVKWHLGFRSRLTKNFHEYEVATNDQSNIEYAISQRADLGYSLSDKLIANLTLRYGISQTYRGNRKESFAAAQELALAIRKDITLGFGHSNEGGLLKPNGDSNLSLFDENSSTLYGYIEFVN